MPATITYNKIADVSVSHKATNAVALATAPAPGAGFGYAVIEASVSFGDDTLKGQLWEIVQDPGGSEVILRQGHYPGGSQYDIPLKAPVPVAANKAVGVRLAAGGAAKVGVANISCYKRPQ